MTDEELLQMVKGALGACPDAGATAEKSAAQYTNHEAIADVVPQQQHMLAAAARRTWAYQQRASQLREADALDGAKASGKRICQLCKAVEGDGRAGCLETFPPQHRWVKL